MGGKNMAYVTGPLQIAAGAAGEYFAPGNPFSTALIGGGIGQVSGKAAGGTGNIGEMLGLAGGGLGGSLSGMGGPFDSLLGGGSTGGEGLRSMLGMGPSSNQQLLNLASGQYGAGPGGADPLIAQGAGDLATYEGIPNAPGYAPVPGAATPTAAAQAGTGGGSSFLNTASQVAPVVNALDKSQPQVQPATAPAFKSPIAQAPVAPKGQAPATSVTPTVTTVPQPQTVGGRTTQDAYRKLIESLSGGNMGLG